MVEKDKFLYSAKDLSFSYSVGKRSVPVIHEVSCEIPRGELVAISGPSGSGKSTLLHILGLIEEKWQGELQFDGHEVAGLRERAKSRLRRNDIGFIFQQHHLFPVLSAEENVSFFLARQKVPRGERKERVLSAMEAVDLADQMKKRPNEMSGGQQQRVAIARALAKQPQVIIADEPTASLDSTSSREVMKILSKLVKESGLSVVVASHDPMALSFADRHYSMFDGKLEEKSC